MEISTIQYISKMNYQPVNVLSRTSDGNNFQNSNLSLFTSNFDSFSKSHAISKNNNYGVTFGYGSILKKYFNLGLFGDRVKKDPLGNDLVKGNVDLDHAIAKALGGKDKMYNYSLMDKIANRKKGKKAFWDVISEEGLIAYLKQFIGLKVKNFDGNKYVEQFQQNLLNETGKTVDAFEGKNKTLFD